MTTYLFYDIETTGLNKCFDQVLQFAAIRTDLELNEIAREEIIIKLNSDVIPAPQAIITHRIGPDQFQNGISEYEAMQKIHAMLNEPNTISVGYNTLGFDDEFLRFSFYKNLLPPYTHQYANRCGRMDIYPIALLYYLFKKDIIQWPEGNLKLENINNCNQLANGQAHNAMVDVEVTIALAKKFYQDAGMWQFVTQYFQKSSDENRFHETETVVHIGNQPYAMGFLIQGKIGAKENYAAPVVFLGLHQHYKNQSLFLRLDQPELIKTKEETISDTTRVVRKRYGEPPIFLPLKERYFTLLSDEKRKLCEANQDWLRHNIDLFLAIKKYHQHFKYPDVPERDIDAALYTIDFPTQQEESLFRQFHAAKPEMKLSIAEKIPNPIRKAQAFRILARHFPEVLKPKAQSDFQNYLMSEPVDFRGEKKLTVKKALAEVAELKQKGNLDSEQMSLLDKFQSFFE